MNNHNFELESVTPMSDRIDWPQWAAERVAEYRAVHQLPLRESTAPRYYPVGAVAFWHQQQVIRPRRGLVQGRLYGNVR